MTTIKETYNLLWKCKSCHKDFVLKDIGPSHLKKPPPIYCSVKCRDIGLRKCKDVFCDNLNCRKLIQRPPWQLKRNKHNFCSHDCRITWQRESDYMSGEKNPSWLGGLDCRYRGRNWKQQKQKALKRDKSTCRRCSLTKAAELRVHHVIPYQLFDDYGKANCLSNLITLCKKCHGITEHEYIKSHPDLIQLRRIPKTLPGPQTCIKCGTIYQAMTYKSKACNDCMTIKCLNCGKDHFVKEYYMTKTQKFCSRRCVNEYYYKNGKWPVRKVTPPLIEEMKKLRDLGMSYRNIAFQIGLSKYAVRTNLVKSYGSDVVEHPTTYVDRSLFEEIQALSKKGFSTRKIATKMGIGKSTVARHLKIRQTLLQVPPLLRQK